MKLSMIERKNLRGKIVQILEADYPHHVACDILDATLDQVGYWKGEAATLQEIVWLGQSGYLQWREDPDPEDPRQKIYRYQLTARGHELATGEIHDDSVAWFEPK